MFKKRLQFEADLKIWYYSLVLEMNVTLCLNHNLEYNM